MREDLAKVVVTDAYRRAARAIDKHGFVLLIGEPAAGKTTIASMLAMAAVDQWNASMLKLDHPSTVVERWNPDEPSQFFWLDDAFGVAQYEAFLVHGWNHILPQVKTMLRKGAKIVMTSRNYIYNRARKELKEGAFPLLTESQVVIDVHDLSHSERQQILYNHLKLGRQPRAFRAQIKPHLETVATHERFIPETARRLADPFFTRGLLIDDHALRRFVAKREQLLHEVLQGLDPDSKAALALVYMRNDNLESPITLIPSEAQAIERLGSTIGGCIAALEALNGSLVLHSYADGDSIWRFKHPTIGDAYSALLVQNPELLGIFIQGSALEELLEQVTCGDVGIEKAVIVPKALFPQMLARLNESFKPKAYKSSLLLAWRSESALQGFLARRCSKSFLAAYVGANPDILGAVAEPGLFLYAVSEVSLAVRLREVGLLPEEIRQKFVATVSRYAIDGEDVYALDNERIRTMFTDDEFETLVSTVRAELLPRLDDVRDDWELNHQSSDSAEEHMGQLLESFDTLKKRFGNDPKAVAIIERETQRANEWIAEHTVEEPEREPRVLGAVEPDVEAHSTRSIFDDVDA
jgi:energy-coupling factor transporter ATP-binding protein EcfA2